MRIPLTKYGLPQVVVFPACIVAAMFSLALPAGVVPLWGIITAESALFVLLLWCLSFFRDPERKITAETNVLLSPADGTVTDIGKVCDTDGLEGDYLRIGIFLSVFNVHINRTPCDVVIEKITYRKGRYKNAMDPESGRVNESNDIIMTRLIEPKDRLMVRQISGAIARRIVCCAGIGQQFGCGHKFGMIKFGSRTELYAPARDDVKCRVKVGDKVRAGLTKIIAYQK